LRLLIVPPDRGGNSLRAKFLADTFDKLPSLRKDILMNVLEALIDDPQQKIVIREIQEGEKVINERPLPPIAPVVRDAANELMAQYYMSQTEHVSRIEKDTVVAGIYWGDIPEDMQEQIIALIEHKLTLDFDPNMMESGNESSGATGDVDDTE
jgi:hypothetical protein